ncbi:MAG: hypothetical protein II000_03500 [Clostridia bacterium]|nr:hypothetical protein [Clostridia bacterium]
MKLRRTILAIAVSVLILSCGIFGSLAEGTEPAAEPAAADNGSQLAAFFKTLDNEAGFHIRYELEIMGYNSIYDDQAKGDFFFERNYIEQLGSSDSDSLKVYRDGKMYSMKKSEMTGIYMDVPEIEDFHYYGAMFCTIYQNVMTRVLEPVYETIEYTVGESTFKAEKYPAQSEYGVEQIFCFDENGSLAYMINCANESIGLGEYVYKIDAIDDVVDESLFDITGYEFVDYQTALAEAQAALEKLAG